jgi:hypothetical protein
VACPSSLANEGGFVTLNNIEIVLESGEIVNANAIKREDLFVALKGGGNSFGCVTHLDFDNFLFPQGRLWGDRGTYKSG